MDNSNDQRVDKASLPKGKELPLLIIYDSKKHSLKQVMELAIETFVGEDSLIISTKRHMDELSGITKECKVLDQLSLIGSNWIISNHFFLFRSAFPSNLKSCQWMEKSS